MIFAALMFVLGTWVVQQLTQLPSLPWLMSASLVSILILLSQYFSCFSQLRHAKFLRLALPSIATLLIGICWASGFALWRMSDELPRAWEQKNIAIEGVVAGVPEITELGVRFRFNVEKTLTKSAVVPHHISLNYYEKNSFYQKSDGTLLTSTEQNNIVRAPFHAGERWLLTVRLKRPHGTQNPHGFDFESWALAENIRAAGSVQRKGGMKKLSTFVWKPSYLVEYLRENIQQRITRVLVGKPYIGVIQALVIGDDNQISVADWQVFLRTGTSHLMSISGLHITMLAGLAFGFVSFFWRRSPTLMMRLPTRKAAVIASMFTALAYALIAGFSVPSQRTFYMLMVFALALWSGRQLVISQVLAFALLIVVILDPWAVSAPGFWLSFGAVAMLSYGLGARIGQRHWIKTAVQTQWAVTIGMLPLLLVMFNQASIVSPIANAFAIPLISFVVTPLALLGSFLPVDWLLQLSYQALEVCMWLLKCLNQLPMATWQQHSPAAWTFLPAMLGVFCLLLPSGVPMRMLGLLGFLPMLFIVPVRPSAGEMKVTVLDVGQGLSVVVQTKKHIFLYDTGPKYNEQSDAGSRIVVPFLHGEGVDKIDGLIVSHNDNDHSGGMQSVLSLMPVTWMASSLPKALQLRTMIKNFPCYKGQSWVWDNVKFEVLSPSLASYQDATLKDNDRSCVVKVSSLFGSVLLTGDVEKNTELSLLESQGQHLKSDVLLVPHHGSKTSSSPNFIEAVSPSISIFTPGYLNRYQHPKPEVISRYQTAHSLIYRSDYDGALQMSFDANSHGVGEIEVGSWRRQQKCYWHDDYHLLETN